MRFECVDVAMLSKTLSSTHRIMVADVSSVKKDGIN